MKKQTKRKHYPADPRSMYRVFGRVQEFTPEEQNALTMPVKDAYEAFTNGKAIEDDYHTLAACMNVTMICAEKIHPTVIECAVVGRDAMWRVWERFQKIGQFGFDGPARDEVLAVIEVYEQLSALLTGGQLKSAMVECIKRMKDGDVLAVSAV